MMAAGSIRALGPAIRTRRALPVQMVLEWAFADEFAALNLGDEAARGKGLPTFGTEYLMIERARLGGVRIDTSPGRSVPHEDADLVADAVLSIGGHLGGTMMAIKVAEHARARLTPGYYGGVVPQLVPSGWKNGVGISQTSGPQAKTAVHETISYRHRGRTVERQVTYCPCKYDPSPARIAFARQFYSDWWWALREIYHKIKYHDFKAFDMNSSFPPAQPWKNT